MQSWESWRVPVCVCWGVMWVWVCARGLPRPSPLRCAYLSSVAPVVQGVRSPRNYHLEVAAAEEEVGSMAEALTATVGCTQEVCGHGCGWVTV